MAKIKPFKAVRPKKEFVKEVATLPYDVFSEKEAREIVDANPNSFLKVVRSETAFPIGTDPYSKEVYEKAKNLLLGEIKKGVLVQDKTENYYIYRLTMNGRSQTGLVAGFSVDDYENDVIKKHEKTRVDKELDRTTHIDVTGAHTGLVFLAYKEKKAISELIEKITEDEPVYDFETPDGVRQEAWKVEDRNLVDQITKAFGKLDAVYIADGHHRCASAASVAKMRRKAKPGYDGNEEFNYILAVAFPDNQLKILPYNRVIKELNGLSKEDFIEALKPMFEISELEDNFADKFSLETEFYGPKEKGVFDMYLDGKWYELKAHDELMVDDPVDGLDCSILQNNVLEPILGIEDPKKDSRIDFVGGIRGLKELEKRCKEDSVLAFALYPTSMKELFGVTDAGRLMPPKSTWFEPKLESGLFVHMIDE